MQVLDPCPRPTESETLGLSLANVFTASLQCVKAIYRPIDPTNGKTKKEIRMYLSPLFSLQLKPDAA